MAGLGVDRVRAGPWARELWQGAHVDQRRKDCPHPVAADRAGEGAPRCRAQDLTPCSPLLHTYTCRYGVIPLPTLL